MAVWYLMTNAPPSYEFGQCARWHSGRVLKSVQQLQQQHWEDILNEWMTVPLQVLSLKETGIYTSLSHCYCFMFGLRGGRKYLHTLSEITSFMISHPFWTCMVTMIVFSIQFLPFSVYWQEALADTSSAPKKCSSLISWDMVAHCTGLDYSGFG